MLLLGTETSDLAQVRLDALDNRNLEGKGLRARRVLEFAGQRFKGAASQNSTRRSI